MNFKERCELHDAYRWWLVLLVVIITFLSLIERVYAEQYILVGVSEQEEIQTVEEIVYVETGEGCLSVNREIEGIVPRYARVTMEGFDEEGNPVRYRVREELAIAFQHELDHLNGVLFFDHIDPKNPRKNEDFMRAI